MNRKKWSLPESLTPSDTRMQTASGYRGAAGRDQRLVVAHAVAFSAFRTFNNY